MATEIKKSWYKEMSVYQIWPRSFCDGDGDGIGDLKGVLSKLDYIKSLGVDAIWFSPLYKSPQKDYGYDIADYRSINPEYGTLEEFKTVLDEAHKRGLRVIMDLVVNHTSNEHEWFLESKKGHDNPYHDYYYWKKGRFGGKRPPNNWMSTFAGRAWEYDKDLDEYYLHLFAVEQPDLNMDNPKVRQEVKDIMKFWLDMGVDGFREDVITFISKKEGLPSSPYWIPVATGIENYMHGPHLDEYLMEFKNEVLSKYDCMTVGEAPMMTTKRALKHITEGENQQLNMMFHFEHMGADCLFYSWMKTGFQLKRLKKVYTRWQKDLYGKAWNALYIENHDQPRIINRYGSVEYRVESAKMLATMYICQSGTPFIYQGQEIGMLNYPFESIDQFTDVSTINNYGVAKALLGEKNAMSLANYASRDNARTPVQWNDSKNAGFTTADEPWFVINPNYKEINVEAADKDPNSILNYYRKLLKFRKENEIVIYGSYEEHYASSKNMFVYSRHLDGKKMLVINSFTDKAVAFKAPEGFDLTQGKLMLSNYDVCGVVNNGFTLRPYETRVYLWE
ncbi:MAG: alpha-glucosidase [Clostridia bacterium]|nr:alpha-glucosidase [Clostridia bacterium]